MFWVEAITGLLFPDQAINDAVHEEPMRIVDQHLDRSEISFDGCNGAIHRVKISHVQAVMVVETARCGETLLDGGFDTFGTSEAGDLEARIMDACYNGLRPAQRQRLSPT